MTDLLANDVAEDNSLFDPVQADMSLADTTSSEKNLMAQSAIIKGENPVESYAELAGMSDEERKVETLAIKEEADLLEQEANIAMIGDLLADPELAVEKKEAIISGVPGIKPTSSLQRTAEILHTKVSGRETESQERRLATVSELIAPTVEMMTLKQKVINAFSYDEDGDSVSLVNNLGDFAELFTPFLEQAYMYQIRQQVGSGEISTTQDLLNAVMLGEAKVDAREAYKDMAPDERKEFLENALNIFNSIKTFNIFNDNDLIQLDNLLSITQEGYYGTTERVLEDIGSVIDAIPALNIIYRAGLKPISKMAKAKTISIMQKAGLRRTASSKQPASVTSLAEQVNPEVARDMAKAVADDETGEVAEVLTGSSKTEAEVEMHGPQPATPDGSVLNKPFAMDRRIAEAAYEETGKIYRTPGELARLATKLDRELAEVRNVVRSDEMHTSPIVMDNGNLKISESYTTPDGGFHSPEDALKAVVQNLEYYGVKESDVTILRKVGDEYVPTSVKEVAGKKVVKEGLSRPQSKEAFIKDKIAAMKADKTGNWPPDKYDETLEALERGEVPKVFEKEFRQTVPEEVGDEYVPTSVKEVAGKKEVRETVTKGQLIPASEETIKATKEEFILEKKAELTAETSSRLSRGDRKQLLKEKRDLEEKLSKVEDVPEKPVKKKDLSARQAKREAEELTRKLSDEERAIFQERIALINQKLAASNKGQEAEADLTRLEQGIIPERFKGELSELIKSKETRAEPKTVPEEVAEELSPINMQDDFIARVDFDYAPRAIDFVGDIDGVKIRDDLDVGVLNFLDTLSSKAPTPGGSTASRWLFQFSHLLHPTITKASGSVVDQSNRLHKVMSDLYKEGVADPLKNLPNERAERLIKVMEDQNIARKNYTLDELEDLGIVEANELQILQNWKYVNDQNWHLTNRDTNMSLRSKGYVRYVDNDNGDEFIGKILKPNEKRPNTVYDPATGKTKLSKDVWDELEATGGKVFTLRSPQIIDEVEVRHIIVRGEEGSRYLKSIQLDDISLPYIPGHYHISYKDHYFIKRTLVDEAGNDVSGTTQAIMTAPETTSAQAVVDRFSENAKSAGKGRTWRYEYEAGRELDPVDLAMRRFEVNEHAGLSSQRKRGETLRSFDSSNPTDLSPKIADPLEAHKQSIAELAKRVPMREYLEDLEQRIITRYGKVLPKNEYGKPKLPNSGEKLKGAGTKDAKLMADARTMIEHYNYMKFGYFNGIDTAWRKSLLRTSQVAGKVSKRLEKSIMGIADEFPSFIGALKGMTFNAHIALSAPPSQWMVQGLPALMNSLLHPSYVMSGKIVRDMSRLKTALVAGDDAKLLRKVYGKTKADEMLALKADWERSGLGVGVDKHLIVEHGLEGMIGTNKFKRTKAVHDAIVDTGRKMGFDVGETFQLMAFFLANRNDAIKAGKSMSNARHFDEVRAKTRTMTMNMNKAGEMPWNKNSLSLWTQFMISPYKSLTMMLDRGLTAEERIKIGTWQLLAMPLPIYMTSHVRALVGVTGEEGDFATEVITNGLLGGTFNTLANAVYKDAGSASWQRNVQLDPTFSGPLTFLHELSKDPQGVSTIQKIAQMSPALALINPDGYNPVVFNMAKSFGRLIASPVVDDYEALKEMKAFGDAVFQSTALTRGLSTAYKDQFANEARKRYSALSGKVQDEDVSWMESLARGAVGMETTTQLVDREVNARLYDGSAEARKDVDLIIKELSREATIEGFNVGDPKRNEYILSNFSLAFPDGRVPPKTASYLLNKLDPSMSLTQKMLTGYGYGVEEVEKLTKVLGTAHPEAKAMYDYIQSEKAVQDLLEED